MTILSESGRTAMLVTVCLIALTRGAAAEPASLAGVAVDVRPDKKAYVLGEPVTLKIRIANQSSRAVAIPAAADVWVGHVEVFIAAPGRDYEQYTGPGWGVRDVINGGTRVLEAGQSWTTEAVMLYNHGVAIAHLSAAARADAAGRILESGFAFRSPGLYRIKVLLHGSGFADAVGSDAVEITAREPHGNDRIVWTALNRSPEVAYFLHAGEHKGHPLASNSLATVELLQQLAAEHPSSRYADAIQGRLAAHERALERLRDRGLAAP